MCSPKGSIECLTKMEGDEKVRRGRSALLAGSASQNASFPVFVRSFFFSCFNERNTSVSWPSLEELAAGLRWQSD